MNRIIRITGIFILLSALTIGTIKLFKLSIYMPVKNTSIYGNVESPENTTRQEVNFTYYIDESRVKNLRYMPSIETLFIFDESKNYISQVPTIQTVSTRGGVEEKRAYLAFSCDLPELKIIHMSIKKNGFIYMKQGFASVPSSFLSPNPETDFIKLYVDREKLKDLQCD